MSIDYEKLFNLLDGSSVDYAEVFHERTKTTIIQKEAGRFEKLHSGTDEGVGMRVIKNFNIAYGFSNRIERNSLEELARRTARADTSQAGRDIVFSYPMDTPSIQRILVPSSTKGIDEKVSVVSSAEKAAKGFDNRIVNVNVTYIDTEKEVWIYNSARRLIKDRRVYTTLLVHVVASDGRSIETGYNAEGGLIGWEIFEGLKPEEVATKAARLAVSLLTARPAPAGRMTVVLGSEAGGTMIHEAVGHGLEADHVLDGSSIYKDSLGQKVASGLITVIDDPTLPNRRGSYTYDDEGIPAQKKVLIKDGVLVDFMYDILSAMKAGRTSNGNGRRESWRHKPIPRMSNTYIAPGAHKREEIIKSVEKGLFVKKMGGGEVNTLTGDFVFHVMEGYLIEKGAIGEMVRNATITGNGPEILRSIDMVGSDLGFGIGTCGKEEQGVPVADAQPTLRIPEMVVGGVEI